MDFFKMLNMQIHILFTRKLFLITFGILFCVNIYNFIVKMISSAGVDKYYMLPSSLAFILNWSFEGRAFVFIVAILAAIPFGSSYSEDSKAKLSPTIFTRTSSYNYYFAKLASVFISTFLCISIPFIINQLLCIDFFSIANISSDATLSSSHSSNYFANLSLYAFKEIYLSNIHMYNFIYILIFSAFWGLLSVFSCAISFCLTKLKAVVIIIPFLLSQLSYFAEVVVFGNTPVLNKVYFSFSDYILPQSYGLHISPMIFIGYVVVFIASSILLVTIKVREERLRSN